MPRIRRCCQSATDPSNERYVQIGGYEDALCGLKQDGTVACYGALNDTVPTGVEFREVQAAGGRACGIRKQDGITQCWGSGNDPGNSLFTTLSMGSAYSCGSREGDGQLECWDTGGYGAPPAGAFSAVSAGWVSACAIARDTGLTQCFGWWPHQISQTDLVSLEQGHFGYCTFDINGELLCSGKQATNQPTEPTLQVSVRQNGSHACGIRACDNALLCWGWHGLYDHVVPTGRRFSHVITHSHGYCAIILDEGGPDHGKAQCMYYSLP